MTDEERWLPVVGYEGIAEVSSIGRVRTVTRVMTRSNGTRLTVKGHIKALTISTDGYLRTGLSRSGHTKTFRVHRLVAEAFLGDGSGLEVRHLDGDPMNNRVGNLKWGTSKENSEDTMRHGRNYCANKTHCKRGHRLEYPNLYAHEGIRPCKACALARARIHDKGGVGDMQAISDQYYQSLTTAKIA